MTNVGRWTAIAAGIVILIGAGRAVGQDWPQWRGPNRDGKTTGFVPPQSWPKELTRKWNVPVGLGDSTPALVGDKLFTFGRQGAYEVIRCLDVADGRELWKEIYPAEMIAEGPSAQHPGPRSSPIVVDGKVCTLGLGAILSCLDAASGKVLWRKQSAADYLDTPCRFESSMSPIAVDGMCIVHVGDGEKGAIVAFDLTDGAAKWRFTGDAPAPSSPVLMTADGVRQLVTITDKQIIGVSLADRSLLWQVPFKARPVNSTTPIVAGQTVIVTGWEVGTLAIKIAGQGGKFTAEQVWANTNVLAGGAFSTPVLRDGLLFGYANAKFVCLSAETGQVLWADKMAHGHTAAIVDAGSCLMALALNGDLCVYEPTDKQYMQLARYKMGEPEFWAHPIVAGKRIFIRDKDSVTLWTLE
ncbi:MAG: PQQ-binding-like beta-propeller repeat protein [Solirubrobacterales bacterium]